MDSALMQEAPFGIEIVVGEDCSPDGTRGIVEEIAAAHPGIVRLLTRDGNLGMQGNFEDALAACQGEYVAFLEGDDYWLARDKIAKQAALLDANASAAACFHRVEIKYEDGPRQTRILPEDDGPWITERLIQECFTPFGSLVIRRSFLPLPLPDWVKGLSMLDWPLAVLLALRGPILLIDEALSAYRVHKGGAWSQLGETERIEKEISFYRAALPHLPPKLLQPANFGLADRLYDLAHHKRKAGRLNEARTAFREALSLQSPGNALPLRRRLRMAWQLRGRR